MADFVRKSDTEWEWQQGKKTCSVRYFPSTKRLIWSGWRDTPDGPTFEQGFAQPVQNFLQAGVPDREPPQALLDDLRRTLEAEMQPKRGLFGWLRGDA